MDTPVRVPDADAPPESTAHDEHSTLAGSGLGFLEGPASLRRPSLIEAPLVAGTDHEVLPTASTNRPLDRSPVPALYPVGDA